MSTLGSLSDMGSYFDIQTSFNIVSLSPCAKCLKIEINLNWAYGSNIGGTTAKQNAFDIMSTIHQ